MNNIHENDWAEDNWSGHTGMDSFSDFSIADTKADEAVKDTPEAVADPNGIAEQEDNAFDKVGGPPADR